MFKMFEKQMAFTVSIYDQLSSHVKFYQKEIPELIAIDGETLALVFMKEKSEADFFKLAAKAKAIVFGRLTPQ